MALDFRVPTEEDIQELLRDLSLEDRREILAQGVDPEWGIRSSIRNSSEVVAVLNEGSCFLITGVCPPSLGGHAYPWLLATPELQRHPRKLLVHSRLLLGRWRKLYPYMENFVDARHHRAITWLHHLGADFEFLPAYGIYKRPFYKFSFGSNS